MTSGESGEAEARGERRLVGEALDSLAAILRPYVDAAMTGRYGADWTEYVSNENAARRKDGKRFPVSKNDLQALLQQLRFQRIEPWVSQPGSARIAAYAAEIITVRNLWAHSESLQGEHIRLIDTIGRLLDKLGLPVPDGLALGAGTGPAVASKSAHVVLPVDFGAVVGAPDPIEEAVARLGETVRHPAELFLAWSEGTAYEDLRWPVIFSSPGDIEYPDDIEYVGALLPAMLRLHAAVDEVDRIIFVGAGGGVELTRALAAMTKWIALGVWNPERKHQQTIALMRLGKFRSEKALVEGMRDDLRELDAEDRDALLNTFGETSAAGAEGEAQRQVARDLKARVIGALNGVEDRLYEVFDRESPAIEALESSFDQVRADPTRLLLETIQAAAGVPEGVVLTHRVLREANFALYVLLDERGGESRGSALQHLRDAIAQQRMLVGLAPAAEVESERQLAGFLILEGRLCNDLDWTDDAIRAFARADEIVDRYPLADPFLAFDAPGSALP